MKTLIIGPSPRMQGGITTVISTQRDSRLWEAWRCVWIGTTLSKPLPWKLLWLATALIRYAWHLPLAKIVHIHLTDGISANRKKLFFYPAYWLGKRVVVHFHAPSFDPSEAPRRFAGLAGMFRKAHRVVALSQNWARLIKQNVSGARVEVVPNAVARPDQVPDASRRTQTIVYAGILNWRKGYQLLLKAFASVHAQMPGWNLVLAGDGEIETARQLVSELGLAGRVEVPGWVPRHRMLELMAQSRIFCLPSHAEGFPMTVLEAFAHGCAVITTRVGGLEEELEDGRDLLFVRPGDVESLARSILRLALSEELTVELSRRGRDLSNDRYSIQSSHRKLEELYREVLA